MYVSIYACMYVCMYVYVCIYTYINIYRYGARRPSSTYLTTEKAMYTGAQQTVGGSPVLTCLLTSTKVLAY